MSGNTTIKARIWLLLALACLTAVALGALNYFSLDQTGIHYEEAARVAEVVGALDRARAAQERFLRTNSDQAAEDTRKALNQARLELGRLGQEEGGGRELAQALAGYRDTFDQMVTLSQTMMKNLAEQDRSSHAIFAHVRTKVVAKVEANKARAIIMAEDGDKNEDTLLGLGHVLLEHLERCQLAFSRLMLNGDLKAFTVQRQEVAIAAKVNARNLKALVPSLKDEELIEAASPLVERANDFFAGLDKMVGLWKRREAMANSLDKLALEIAGQADRFASETKKSIDAGITTVKYLSMGVALGAIFLVLVAGWLMSRSITKVLARIIGGLSNSSRELGISSHQVSEASQSLAEGSTRQAASLEETSASLEEMSSMTKQNAEAAGQAGHLAEENRLVMSQAQRAMSELSTAMDQIRETEEETSKIIKTIDEIAFQTNLLALNAAVEAARAGEAGAGFAVVADEVRNLAQRAAEAAKNTSQLIEGSVNSINHGVTLVEDTNKAFGKVAQSSEKMDALVMDIAAASKEQAQGIEQINAAMSDMDQITQQVAAGAEETAAASNELNGQAEIVGGFVDNLTSLVVGNNGSGRKRARAEVRDNSAEKEEPTRQPKDLPALGYDRRAGGKRSGGVDDLDDFADF